MPNSYAVSVKVKGSDAWVHNGLRFKHRADAHAYAVNLKFRWKELTDYNVEDSEDEPNATFPVPSDRYPVRRNGVEYERSNLPNVLGPREAR